MIICGINSVPYVNLAIITRTSADVPGAADFNPVARFYRVDPNSGTLALDLNVGVSGYITLTPLFGATGLYSAPIDMSTLEHKQYHVYISYEMSGSARVQLEEIMLLSELDVLSANDESFAGGMAFASRGAVIP